VGSFRVAFPEAFRELIVDGAQIVIVPTYCMLNSFWSVLVSIATWGSGPEEVRWGRSGCQMFFLR
jgi:hypothetical protein